MKPDHIMRRRSRFWIWLIAALLAHGALADDSSAPVGVVVSVPPQAHFVEAVGGDLVQVHIAVPPGSSPHTFSPTPRQVAAMAGARMYVVTGVEVELQLLPRLQAMRPDLVVVGEPATEHHHHGHDHHHDHADPHRWLDPRLAAADLAGLADALAELFPDEASAIARRKDAEVQRLEDLHQELAVILGPCRGMDLVVAHPAFGHLAAAYGLNQIAVEQGGHEPTPRHLGELMQRSLGTLFVQPQFSRATLAPLLRGRDVALVELDPLARDYHENMRTMARAIAQALATNP